MLFHDVGNAFEYVKSQIDKYCISMKRFNDIREKGMVAGAKRFLIENDICKDEGYYQWIIEELEVEDAPQAAIVTGSREEALSNVLRLMKEGYYPVNIATAAVLTKDPISRPLLVEFTVLMTTFKPNIS